MLHWACAPCCCPNLRIAVFEFSQPPSTISYVGAREARPSWPIVLAGDKSKHTRASTCKQTTYDIPSRAHLARILWLNEMCTSLYALASKKNTPLPGSG